MSEGEIRLDDSLELLVRQSYNSAAVTVHGITREESLSGVEEADAARAALRFLEGGVLVGHHVDFDATVLDRTCERHGLPAVSNATVDTASLALLLAEEGLLPDLQTVSLDALLRLFAIEPHDRHTAAGDAFLTALVFQRLLRIAADAGRTTLAGISEKPARQAESA